MESDRKGAVDSDNEQVRINRSGLTKDELEIIDEIVQSLELAYDNYVEAKKEPYEKNINDALTELKKLPLDVMLQLENYIFYEKEKEGGEEKDRGRKMLKIAKITRTDFNDALNNARNITELVPLISSYQSHLERYLVHYIPPDFDKKINEFEADDPRIRSRQFVEAAAKTFDSEKKIDGKLGRILNEFPSVFYENAIIYLPAIHDGNQIQENTLYAYVDNGAVYYKTKKNGSTIEKEVKESQLTEFNEFKARLSKIKAPIMAKDDHYKVNLLEVAIKNGDIDNDPLLRFVPYDSASFQAVVDHWNKLLASYDFFFDEDGRTTNCPDDELKKLIKEMIAMACLEFFDERGNINAEILKRLNLKAYLNKLGTGTAAHIETASPILICSYIEFLAGVFGKEKTKPLYAAKSLFLMKLLQDRYNNEKGQPSEFLKESIAYNLHLLANYSHIVDLIKLASPEVLQHYVNTDYIRHHSNENIKEFWNKIAALLKSQKIDDQYRSILQGRVDAIHNAFHDNGKCAGRLLKQQADLLIKFDEHLQYRDLLYQNTESLSMVEAFDAATKKEANLRSKFTELMLLLSNDGSDYISILQLCAKLQTFKLSSSSLDNPGDVKQLYDEIKNKLIVPHISGYQEIALSIEETLKYNAAAVDLYEDLTKKIMAQSSTNDTTAIKQVNLVKQYYDFIYDFNKSPEELFIKLDSLLMQTIKLLTHAETDSEIADNKQFLNKCINYIKEFENDFPGSEINIDFIIDRIMVIEMNSGSNEELLTILKSIKKRELEVDLMRLDEMLRPEVKATGFMGFFKSSSSKYQPDVSAVQNSRSYPLIQYLREKLFYHFKAAELANEFARLLVKPSSSASSSSIIAESNKEYPALAKLRKLINNITLNPRGACLELQECMNQMPKELKNKCTKIEKEINTKNSPSASSSSAPLAPNFR